MKITELLTESTPKTLYHGTLMKFVPTIMKFGLLPTVGDFTKKTYQEYTDAGIDLEPLVFAADKKGLTKCISAMIAWLKEHGMLLTAENFYKNTALIVIKQGEDRMQRRSADWQDIIHHPDTVEPKDYYSRDTVEPSFYMTGDRLKNFLRRNSINLYDFGIDDSSTRRAELIRTLKKPLMENNLLEIGQILDLTKNYQQYKRLYARIEEISQKGKIKLLVVFADPISPKKGQLDKGQTIFVSQHYIKNCPVIGKN